MTRLFIIPLLLISFSGKAQFMLTPDGFKNIQDENVNYLVSEFPGKSREELFKSALLYLTTSYYTPREVLSTLENKIITVSGF